MYEEIVESSRFCAMGYNGACDRCIFCGKSNDKDGDCYQQLHKAAANAIEKLSMKLHGDEAAIAGMKREIERMVVASKPHWIPVTERLPDNIDEEVLVCNAGYGKDGTGFATVAIYNGNGWLECWERKQYIASITYWMPLPEPPKEET